MVSELDFRGVRRSRAPYQISSRCDSQTMKDTPFYKGCKKTFVPREEFNDYEASRGVPIESSLLENSKEDDCEYSGVEASLEDALETNQVEQNFID